MKYLAVIFVFLLGACSNNHPLTSCRGSFAPANPGQWTPTQAELSGTGR